MHPPTPILAAFVALSLSSCGLSYQERQDNFRQRYVTGCQVFYSPPAQRATHPLSISPAAISEVIESTREQLQFCYLEALELWPQLEGRIVINFTVEANGTVGEPAVAVHNSTIGEPSIGCCMAHVAATWKFPEPPDGKPFAVEYPFELVTEILKMRFSTSVTTAEPFKSQFPATVIVPPVSSTRTSTQYPR